MTYNGLFSEDLGLSPILTPLYQKAVLTPYQTARLTRQLAEWEILAQKVSSLPKTDRLKFERFMQYVQVPINTTHVKLIAANGLGVDPNQQVFATKEELEIWQKGMATEYPAEWEAMLRAEAISHGSRMAVNSKAPSSAPPDFAPPSDPTKEETPSTSTPIVYYAVGAGLLGLLGFILLKKE